MKEGRIYVPEGDLRREIIQLHLDTPVGGHGTPVGGHGTPVGGHRGR